ncbi:MAG: hypothetical protein F6K28_40415 [Microcoleus sp. SIO2G3]|nr:hypothetical protein [Microcoleus sp. SIO2G3]
MLDPLEELKAEVAASLEARRGESKARSICKRFYVNAAEERSIQERCQGVNQSHFFRACVLDRAIPRPRAIIPQVNRDTYVQLASLRSTINQIARALNSTLKQQGNSILSPADLEKLTQQLEKLTQWEGVMTNLQRQLKLMEAGGDDREAHEE